MSSFIESVAIQETPSEQPPAEQAPGPFGGGFLVPMILIFGVFYFVLIRPERNQRRKREELLGQLKKGDKIMTTGGMHGSIAAVHEEDVTIQVADGVRLKFARQAIQTVFEKEEKEAAEKS